MNATAATFNISPRDGDLTNCIVESIRRDPLLSRESILVDVRHGRAVLTGTVSSCAARVAAREAAEDVQGVASVATELIVNVPPDLRRSDAEIRDAVLDTLKWRACLPSGAVTVTVSNGCVTLSGRVDWSYQRKLAETVLLPLRSIMSISNELRVSDRQIQMEVSARIRTALRVAAEMRADAIKVEVRDGVVTLLGPLPAVDERAYVSAVVQSHPEVRRVHDHIHSMSRPRMRRRTSIANAFNRHRICIK
ncbi:BON domain-containing protein [Paraburkholderia azotifigens]|uniref:BON domain-containing protein n=1 Tax=Paraburkholderia azotifigens TaxID=2057004 RepID=A0A5C6VHM5_9BURK|nr:BON domain-containing protein [Paraburkholderia azotifigens]TXC84419.1 BON domain-containing protein [Paraburkholderia azotifigens]